MKVNGVGMETKKKDRSEGRSAFAFWCWSWFRLRSGCHGHGKDGSSQSNLSKHRCTGEWHRPTACSLQGQPTRGKQLVASSWERQQQQHLIHLSVSLTDKPPRQATIWMTKYERSLFWGDKGPCFSPIGTSTLPFCHSVCLALAVPGSRHAFCHRSEDLQVARHTCAAGTFECVLQTC